MLPAANSVNHTLPSEPLVTPEGFELAVRAVYSLVTAGGNGVAGGGLPDVIGVGWPQAAKTATAIAPASVPSVRFKESLLRMVLLSQPPLFADRPHLPACL